MIKRIYKRTNPYPGQSEVLTKDEAMLYEMIKQTEGMKKYCEYRKQLEDTK